MMYNIGDKFICKVDQICYRLLFHKVYEITFISDEKNSTGMRQYLSLQHLDICVYINSDELYSYFYTEREARKIKLENVKNKIDVKNWRQSIL